MGSKTNRIFKDEEVAHHILSLISEANEYVLFITPYVHLWGHVRNALTLATGRGVAVTFLVRRDPDVVRGADVKWLLDHRVDVRAVERLHAKIYLNETTTMTSSMNLHESSSKNSLEIGTVVGDHEEEQAIREYVDSRLMKLAEPLGQPSRTRATARSATQPSVWDQAFESAPGRTPATRAGKPIPGKNKGHCIRCRTRLRFDASKPLCDDCYDIWAEYGNRDYPESACHSCGKKTDSSYAMPLCRSCYKSTA